MYEPFAVGEKERRYS